MIKTFTGYKGKMAAAQIGDTKFVLLAANSKQLSILWSHIMAQAGPLDPAGIKSAILIESATLPDARPAPSDPSDLSAPSTLPIDI